MIICFNLFIPESTADKIKIVVRVGVIWLQANWAYFMLVFFSLYRTKSSLAVSRALLRLKFSLFIFYSYFEQSPELL